MLRTILSFLRKSTPEMTRRTEEHFAKRLEKKAKKETAKLKLRNMVLHHVDWLPFYVQKNTPSGPTLVCVVRLNSKRDKILVWGAHPSGQIKEWFASDAVGQKQALGKVLEVIQGYATPGPKAPKRRHSCPSPNH